MRKVLGKAVLIASFVGLSACALDEQDPADDSLDEPGIAEQSVEDAEQKLDLTQPGSVNVEARTVCSGTAPSSIRSPATSRGQSRLTSSVQSSCGWERRPRRAGWTCGSSMTEPMPRVSRWARAGASPVSWMLAPPRDAAGSDAATRSR
jgi:hypothetical protein